MDSQEAELRDEDEVVDRAISLFMVAIFLLIVVTPLLQELGVAEGINALAFYGFTAVCVVLVIWLTYVMTMEDG